MATKAELERAQKEAQVTIAQQQKDIAHLKKCLRHAMLSVDITATDLQLKIDWVEGDEERSEQEREDPHRKQLYQETGSEQAERFERGINLAIQRLGIIKETLEAQQCDYDWIQSLWQSDTGA